MAGLDLSMFKSSCTESERVDHPTIPALFQILVFCLAAYEFFILWTSRKTITLTIGFEMANEQAATEI